ncbi:tetratricopeptide repeat protein [bacterium]|nr:tetratricopeptide repeat protein [bacterium]
MQYQELIRTLPHHYLNWSATSICPKSATWQELLEVTGGQIDVCLLPLLNLATGCLDPNEVYCEVGCDRGASLIAALGDRQDVMAYAVDDFQNSPEDAAESLLTTLEQADLSDRLLFCQQNVLEFFLDLRQLETAEKIGVLFLNVGVDYRTTLMALLLAEPFLSDRALLMVHHGIDQALMQAIQDFIAIYPQCQLLLEMSETSILSWDRHQASSQTFENIETPNNSDYHQQETDVSHLYKLAISYHQQGQLDEAEARYRQILDITENRPEVWLNFGILCYMNHHLDEALYALSRSIDLDNSRAIAYYHIGLVLEALNRSSEAIAAYQKALSLDKNYIDAYNNLGNLLFECGHFDAAEKLYREAIAIDPNFPGTYINLSKLLLETGYIDTAAKVCRDALLYAPDDEGLRASLVAIEREEKHLASVYFNAGNIFYNQRKFGEALPRYSLSLAVQSLETITYLLLAGSTISCQQQGILAAWWCHRSDRYPDLALLYKSCVQALCSENCTETAMEIARSGEICFPELPIFSFFSRLALPILYEQEQDIPVYRQRFEKGLQELVDAVQQLDMSDRDRLDAYEQAIGSFTNFFLSYQGKMMLISSNSTVNSYIT